MARNLGFSFGRTPEDRDKEFKELEERLSQEAKAQKVQTTILPPRFKEIANPEDFIQINGITGVSGFPILISKYEIPDSNNKDYELAHRFLFKKGLYMPTPAIFMVHLKNIIDAQNGQKKIYDAAGDELSRGEINNLYLHLVTAHKNIFLNENIGNWAWLNAKFVEPEDSEELNLEKIIGINDDGTFEKKLEKLQNPELKSAYFEIDFNFQDLPQKKSKNQKYEKGKNILFYPAIKDQVVRVISHSEGVGLYCAADPRISNSGLGTFGCTEPMFKTNTEAQQ